MKSTKKWQKTLKSKKSTEKDNFEGYPLRESTSFCMSTSFEEQPNITFFVNFQMFFVDFRREITEKGLKQTKKVENGWKK